MPTPWHNPLKPLALGLGLLALALLGLGSSTPPARAALAQGLGQAGPTCTVCLDGGCDYTTIQAAVDDSNCQEIKVAQGVYTGAQARPVPAGYSYPPASGLITQVVYISRTVAVRGGYTTTNWTTPYPLTQPTTLDASRLGRVMVIAGNISPTIEGLGLTGGNAAGLGGLAYGGNSGGGVYVISANVTIYNCWTFGNTAGAEGDAGGGLYLDQSAATLISNSVTSNTAYRGGGLSLWRSPATLSANSITTNTATYGGGLNLENSNAVLVNNVVTDNRASWVGGGLILFYSAAALHANSIVANTADYGGGLYLYASSATLTNTIVADNQADNKGSGLLISGSSSGGLSAPRLLHTTIARNGGGDGSGLYLDNAFSGIATAWLTNTILVSQSVGVTVAEGCTATLNGTLWYSNGADWGGAGALAHSGDTTGSPAFVDPGGGDYHLRLNSAAIDRGIDAGVTTDRDGLPRDAQPDLGAYEFQGLVIDTYLPVIVKGAR